MSLSSSDSFFFACTNAMTSTMIFNATLKPTMNDQQAMKHWRWGAFEKQILSEKQPSDLCSQASQDASEWKSMPATSNHMNKTFLPSMTSPSHLIKQQLSWEHTQLISKTNMLNDLCLILHLMQKQWQGQLTSKPDQKTCKHMYFAYAILTVELAWQNSNLIHLDNSKQATSVKMKQTMLLRTWMDQMMHYNEQAKFPFDFPPNNVSWTCKNTSFHLIEPETRPLNHTSLYTRHNTMPNFGANLQRCKSPRMRCCAQQAYSAAGVC